MAPSNRFGITNTGTGASAKLVVHGEDHNQVVTIDPADGSNVDDSNPCCLQAYVFGANGFAHHAARDQYFAAKDNTLLTYDSNLQTIIDEDTLTVDGGSLPGDVKGMTFDQDVLYVAFLDGTQGKVSQGTLRVTVTTEPEGIAFSPAGSSLEGTQIGRAL